MRPVDLEPFFTMWEAKWHDSGGKDINNPKIPVKFVRQNGQLVHSATSELPPPPAPINPKLVAEAEQGEE